MEKEFSCSSVTDTGISRKFVAALISCLLMLQIAAMGLQPVQLAEAAALPKGLVYKYAYGVRSDGVSFFSNENQEKVVVNASGKVVFKEQYKDATYPGGTYRQAVLSISSYLMSSSYLNGNLVLCKISDRDVKYGLLDPRTGKQVLTPKYTYAEIEAYAKKKGWDTDSNIYYKTDSGSSFGQKLPNGIEVATNYGDEGITYKTANGAIAKIAGYALGNNPKGFGMYSANNALARTNVAGGNLYYVHNKNGKVGAVNDKGKVLIPFEYDAYYDANAGSKNILLKKGNSWQYFDLSSIGKSSSQTSAATQKAGWVHGSKGWWYRYSDGTYAKGLKKIGNATYYFDSKGWMQTGWRKISGSWYLFKSSGAMATGWQKVGGAWYYMNSSGKMLTGWQTIGKAKYFLSSSGTMKTGWVKTGGAWYYLASSGAMKTGWVKSGGSWYYMSTDGKMVTGKKKIGKATYFLSGSGAMKTGWSKEGSAWYYYAKSGVMQTSKWIGNYWVGSDGKMATNSWVNGGKYYVGSNGAWVPKAKK